MEPAAAASLAASLVLPPPFLEGKGSYENYKKELEIWQLMKTCSAEEQGAIVFRSLRNNEKAKNAALELTAQQIGSKDGLELILGKLDKVYLGDENLRIITSLDQFENFKRSPSVDMTTFLLEFERLHGKLKSHQITYPDGVLAYRLMKAANISHEHEQLLRATVETGKWSYNSVKQQLKKIFNEISAVRSRNDSPTERPIKVEETLYNENVSPQAQECYYGNTMYGDTDVLYYDTFDTNTDDYDNTVLCNNSQLEEHDVYYGPSRGSQPWKWNSGKGPRGRNYQNPSPWRPAERQSFQNPRGFQKFGENSFQQNNNSFQQNNSSRQNSFMMNPKDHRGWPTVCRKCRSTYHYWDQCPHVSQQERMNASKKVLYTQNNEDLYIALFQKSTPTSIDEMVCLMSETFNKAVIDSGCTKTCAGEKWFDAYLETFSDEDKNEIQSNETHAVFRFGDSPPVSAIKKVLLPISIKNVNVLLETEIVSSDVPLLLSKETMKKAKAKMNFVDDKIELFGEEQSMMCTSTGHYAIPIKTNSSATDNVKLAGDVVLFSNYENTDKKVVAKKLHTQFGHPSAKRLIKLIDSSTMQDTTELKQAVEELSEKCDICRRYKKSRPRPVVCFPLASEFNETVAMDLKVFKNNAIYFLHMIDHATRFSQAVVIRSKKAEVILKHFIMSWIAVFGSPQKVLADNGGEFANSSLIDLCENLNINLMTTAAESPWSNGLVEKHNGIVGEAVAKIMQDIHCSVEVALCWAINAKNSLQNIHGFSPYQLVFGKNPNLPSVLNNKLPALEGVSQSHLVADLLNALHSARREFMMLENSEKLRRAMRAQTRTHSNMRYLAGDDVFYKREDERRWRGPGRVVGQDGSKILIKIPTGLISVHSCDVILTCEAEAKRLNGEEFDMEVDMQTEVKCDVEPSLETEERYYVEPDLRVTRSQVQDTGLANGQVEEIQDDEIGDNHQEDDDLERHVNDNNVTAVEVPILEEEEDVPAKVDEAVVQGEVEEKVVNVNRNPDLPDTKQVVQFRETNTDEWKKGVILNRWATVPGRRKEKHLINVKDLDDDTERIVDWKNDVKDWKPFEENVLVMSILKPTGMQKNLILTSQTDDYKEEVNKELQNWKNLNVYEEVQNEGQDNISVRWVLTEKEVDGKKVRKARLVARGYEEMIDTQRDSPTVNKDSQRIAVAIMSAEGWDVQSLDVKAAFLHGKELDRDVYLKPPKEANCPGKLWKLKRCVYGLNDASRFWYFRVKEELNRVGCKNSKFDSSLFTYYTDQLEGILITHVDDFLFAGTEKFYQSVINSLKQTFPISKESSSAFKYIGVELQQTSNGINIAQEKYLDKLKEIEVSSSRLKEKTSPITEEERSELRAAHGKLSWLATQTRPDLSYDVCDLTTSLKHGTVELIQKTNKVIKKAKYNRVFLHYPKLNLKNVKVRCYADASLGKLTDGGSQGGFYVELVDGDKCAPIQWQSKRLRRVVQSTLAAETLAMVEGMESAYLTSKILSEILHNSTTPIPVEAMTDCYSLYEAAHSSTSIDDRRLRIEMAILREGILKKEFKLTWVSTDSQLADCLTKSGSNPRMLVERITGMKVV